jgi:hypothetical protein
MTKTQNLNALATVDEAKVRAIGKTYCVHTRTGTLYPTLQAHIAKPPRNASRFS